MTTVTTRRPPVSRGEKAAPTPGPRPGSSPSAAFGFLLVPVALVTAFMIIPFAITAVDSLFSDDGLHREFVGLANYAALVTDSGFGHAILNTLMWVAGTLLLPVLLGLVFAVLFNSVRWGIVARWAVTVPYALSGSATALMWTFMLQSDGAVNQILVAVGLQSWQQQWLLQWPLNTVTMIIVTAWQGTGAALILFLIGLQAIPAETIEAGRLDGAGGPSMFWHVIVPQLRPMAVVVIGISIVNSLKTFDIVWLLTAGGPGTESETLALTMYRETFTLNRYGYGAAVSVVLTVIVVAASWLYLRRQVGGAGRR
ncbi:carbohydrate ABC transporter permease [Microlunatus sp. Gsoil 973]|jgi:multiple sugar transport system permease protein|uniref:carbohydrate ABC transporter permease n=1 Tax=Microlunatus sp. Gsoil 973 TaxID=2672569 RepID=UPI0012B4F643|nr:sugar ABC transporter permease [Microlunatus sp. Gsoil 973]QGN33201.1 ABC transporter permease subunit [Microlunatus sp. Gsoil 973]